MTGAAVVVMMMVSRHVITVETFADYLNIGTSFSRMLDRINNVRVDLCLPATLPSRVSLRLDNLTAEARF